MGLFPLSLNKAFYNYVVRCYQSIRYHKATYLNVQHTKRYCIQDKKSPNFQDIRPPTHETPFLLKRYVKKDATSIDNFTNKNLAN